MSGSEALDEIEQYLDTLEAGLTAADPDALEIAEPTVGPADLEMDDVTRARALFARLRDLQERTEGQRVRVAGELAGLRRRSGNDGHRRSPSTFDQAM